MSASTLHFYRSNAILAFVITLLCFLATYFLLGFYYTDYEALHDSLFSGKLTPGLPFRSLYFISNIGISYFYTYLYELFPNVEWLSWIYSTYSFFASFIGMYLVTLLLPVRTSFSIRVLLMCGVYALIFAYHQMHFLCTFVSYMSCGLSLIALICLFRSGAFIRSRWLLFICLNVLFVLGTLIKVEAAVACITLIGFFGVFFLQDMKQCIYLFLFPAVLVVSLSLLISIDIKTSTEFCKQIEPDIEAEYQDRANKVPLCLMTTHRDSVLYTTATDIVWSDPNIITPKFLRSLILPEKPLFTDQRQWKRVFKSVMEMTAQYWYLMMILLLSGIVLFFQYDFTSSRRSLYYWLAFESSFWLLLIIQAYIYKLNARSFVPFISLFIICHILGFIANIRSRISWAFYIVLPFILILFAVHSYHLVAESNILKKDILDYRSNYEKIQNLAHDKYLVLNSSSCDYIFLSNMPFHPFDFSAFKRVYITDGSIIPFIPYYRRYLVKECNCDIYAYPSFYDYLRSVHDEVIIVSAPDRMKIIKNYLAEIHYYDLPLQVDDSIALLKMEKAESRGYFIDLKVYRLGR